MTGDDRFREAERRLWEAAGVNPTERRLPLEQTGVTVRIQDTGDGPAVLFVHGSTNSGASWATLIGRLEGFRCVALDRPGCGLSDPVGTPLGVDDLPAHGDMLVVDVLDALGLESAHLVTTSLGGYFGLRAAAAHPERVGRIVHLGWSAGAPSAEPPLLMRLAGMPGVGRMLAALPVNERAVRSMFRQMGLGQALDAGRIPQEVIDCYVALLRHTDTRRHEFALGHDVSPRELTGALLLTNDLLDDVRAPTYFLWGADDPFGGADIARDFVARIPNAELEILPDAGHAVWLDDLDRVAAATQDFLSN